VSSHSEGRTEDQPHSVEDPLEDFLAEVFQEVLEVPSIDRDAHFFDLGGNSLKMVRVVARIQERIGQVAYLVALREAPSVTALAEYLRREYPREVAKAFNLANPPQLADQSVGGEEGFDADDSIFELRHRLEERAVALSAVQVMKRVPPPIFVVGPARSGTSLFRVMLAGHPRLFCPQELHLFEYPTLAQRSHLLKTERTDRIGGLIRAIMYCRECDAETASALLRALEDGGETSRACFDLLRHWAGIRSVVDKTPTNGLSVHTLREMAAAYPDAKFIHLLRHPVAVAHSFVRSRMDLQLWSSARMDAFRLGEVVWTITHQNILDLRREISSRRALEVRYEHLVVEPEQTMREVCGFLGIPFDHRLLTPYDGLAERITDGVYPDSRPIDDVFFHTYKDILPERANAWKHELGHIPNLSEATLRLAESLGYSPEA